MKQALSLALIAILTIAFDGILSPLRAQAADGSLVIAALRVLERDYVGQVRPVRLLNAAIDTLRTNAKLGEDALPEIPIDATEDVAIARFSSEFSQAARMSTTAETDLAYAATRGMLDSLHDSHVFFLTPSEYRDEKNTLAGKAGHLGIGIRTDWVTATGGMDRLFITAVFAGTPADVTGLNQFDEILRINGRDLENADFDTEKNPTVTLEIRRDSKMLTISIPQASIRVPPPSATFIRPGIAYVRFIKFSNGSGKQLRAALQSLVFRAPIKALVLDLRDNGGGAAREMSVVAGAFLPPGTPLAHAIGRTWPPSVLRTREAPIVPHAPLIVLTDDDTSSAAEVVAIALRDAHRATIVGEKTAGHLGAAKFIPLPEGAMMVTALRVLGPHDEQIEGIGVPPDVRVDLSASDMERGVDTQLEIALKALSGTTAFSANSSSSNRFRSTLDPRRVRSINQVFPLEHAGEASDLMMNGNVRFRVVLPTGH